MFGDSLSDEGNVNAATFGLVPSDDYFDSRVFSSGATWIRTLAAQLDVPEPRHYLAGSGDATNYAYGGAQTGDGDSNFASILIPDVGRQINAFKSDGRVLGRQSLCALWIGGNDLNGTSSENAQRVINRTISNLEEHLEELISLGAVQIVVPNVPLLGEIPQHNRNASERRQQNELVHDYNSRLESLLVNLRNRYPETRFIGVDVAAFMVELIADPEAFGFSNTRDQAYTGPLGGIFGGDVVSNPQEYVFWDDRHPTGPIHEIIGMMAAGAVKHLPSSQIQEVVRAGVDTFIRFSSRAWVTYSVERSLDLERWELISEEVPGTGSLISVTDQGAGNLPAAFYRLTLEW